ncbi:hypothetical protein CVV68_17595 [Arthrobacter livingstonensis]|uniref:Ribbon-helix-helix protein CopG domain-containing protein n=1 Tax=Arthrobacter livingstonensis TaxID=670078 RepID=A0A2V5LUE4_9MICC|nr:ribbon-helix-helix protein, CopG family [Arthrobacter livingstonensis]PYI65536.1 hypothetical protein CVV68_17595 [Arthrobacter livingstonensis]
MPALPKQSREVVSVRLPPELYARLDALVERTQRSRGFYLREALLNMLPVLESRYWAHDVDETQRAELAVFGALMAQLNGEGGTPGAEPAEGEQQPPA